MLQLRYFASLREKLGCEGEEISWKHNLLTVGDLKKYLLENHSNWQKIAITHTILTAINQNMADDNSSIKDGDEIAFFPPVTGG
jgi:molybdopterin synthase sulfur carrier subunit